MSDTADIPISGQVATAQRVLHEWNATARAYPTEPLLPELFEQRVAQRPDAVAVVHGDSATSYAALDARANQWARRLRAAGAGPEVLVGVHLERSTEMIAVLLGVLKAGSGYLPLDTAYPRERLELMADDAALSLIVSGHAELALRTRQPVTVITPRDCDRRAPATRPGRRAQPDNLAYVLYTSGSTGRPKGAALTHRSAVDLVFRVGETFGSDLDRVLAATSICFDCSVIEIFGPLGWGGTVVLAETAMDIGTRSEGQGVRLLHTVPSVVDELLRTDRLPASTRTAIVGGERLLPGVVERIYANSSIERLVNIYGPVECTTYVSLAEVQRTAAVLAGPPAIGRPAQNSRIYVLDPAGEPAAVGQPGELYVAGAGLARGYLHRPAATAERFLPDPFGDRPGQRCYRTGDLAYHADDGELHFLGRVDDQLKIRGVRIEPAEVEQALLRHPAVLEAAVVAGGSGRLLTAYLVTGRPVPTEELRVFVGGRLPRPLRPNVYVVVDRLPRTPNGKIDRRQLAATTAGPLAELASGCTEPIAPRTELESMLARLWADALERERVGIHDNLLELGGHSLLVLAVRAGLSGLLGRDLPVRLFFEHPTIAALAAELDRLPVAAAPRADSPQARPIPARRQGAPAPLSPTQRAILARANDRPDDQGLVFPLVVRLTGRPAPNALADACTELVRRHESLRSRIVTGEGGQPMQQALAPGAVRLPIVDVSGRAPARAEELARRLVAKLLDRPFDLASGPLARAVLLRLGADHHVFGLAVHHLVADAWSMETLSHQLLGLYASRIHGQPPTVAEPSLQYADWAAEQLGWLASDAGRAQLAYWRKELIDLPVLRLPDGKQRATVPGPALMHSFHIGAELTNRIAEIARREGATRYMVLLAAFAIMLGRRSGQTDLAIGCPVAGRNRPELTSVLGPCHDALVLRLDLSGVPTFLELLGHVRDRALDAYSHQDVPFTVLVDELVNQHAGHGAEHPLFQVEIGFQERPSLLNYPYSRALMAREPIGNLVICGFAEVPLPPTALDIELAIAVDPDDELEGVLTCRSDLIDADEIGRIAVSFHTILDEATANPHAPI